MPSPSTPESDSHQPSLKVPGTEALPGYRLIAPLGRGGFGEVWECEGPGGLHKAIKFVVGGDSEDDRGERRFSHELEAFERIKAIRHPFILAIERVEVIGGELIVVTELADCQLADRFRECRNCGLPGIPRGELLAYCADAAEGLDTLSAKYGQHLDVKPANLFLVAGHVKIGDYGLATRHRHDEPGSRRRDITPAYGAPEVLRDKPSNRSDQYSLAIVYHELLTGTFPYNGRTGQQMLVQHISAVPDLTRLSVGDQAIVAKALSKRPEERFGSCLEFVSALLSAPSPTDDPSNLSRESGEPHFDESSHAEIQRLTSENRELWKLHAELKQFLQEASEAKQEKDKAHKATLAEKDAQIQELNARLGELAPPSQIPKTRSELEERELELERERTRLQQDRKKLEEERQQHREDESSLEKQMREMEVSMARDRALLARQETELKRLNNEIQHELELMQRGDANLREQLSKFQRRAQEAGNKPPSSGRASEERNPPRVGSSPPSTNTTRAVIPGFWAARSAGSIFSAPPRTEAEKPSETGDSHGPEPSLPPELLDRSGSGLPRKPLSGPDPDGPEDVECSVFAPPKTPQGSVLLVQVFAHTPPQAEVAESMARQFDDQTQRRGFQTLDVAIPRGTRLSIHLLIPGLHVSDPIQHLTWRGRPCAVQFSVEVPPSYRIGPVVGTVCVSLDSIPIGHIKFKLEMTAAEPTPAPASKPAPVGVEARRYHKAFISYASDDRGEVVKRVQMLRQVKVDFFQDVLDLDPGARWEKELYRHIDDCDLFLLFWSSAARKSNWVLKELRYALNRKGSDELAAPEIQPVVIEGPPPPPPPDELAHLHFNDHLLYFINPPPART